MYGNSCCKTIILTRNNQLLVASDVFLLLALFMAKCSVIWLCRRLFAIGQHQQHRLCEGMGALSALWCLAGLLTVNVGCTGTEMIRAGDEKCSGLVCGDEAAVAREQSMLTNDSRLHDGLSLARWTASLKCSSWFSPSWSSFPCAWHGPKSFKPCFASPYASREHSQGPPFCRTH